LQRGSGQPDAEAALKAQKQFPNLRGVRQMLYWDREPVRQAAPRADYCNDPAFRRGFALLEKYGLRDYLSGLGTIAGPPARCIERLHEVEAIGVTNIILSQFMTDQATWMRTFAEEVRPSI